MPLPAEIAIGGLPGQAKNAACLPHGTPCDRYCIAFALDGKRDGNHGIRYMLTIKSGGLDDERVIAMLRFHHDTNHAVTPAGSVHVFDISRLKEPDIAFWAAWDGDRLMGTGALKRMDDANAEVKSMHTLVGARRTGVGSAMVWHIIAQARAMGFRQLWLETGSFDFFAPARALYARHGFVECGPFEGYAPDPNSTFMTRAIQPAQASTRLAADSFNSSPNTRW
jgi:putative acetyltransferase